MWGGLSGRDLASCGDGSTGFIYFNFDVITKNKSMKNQNKSIVYTYSSWMVLTLPITSRGYRALRMVIFLEWSH